MKDKVTIVVLSGDLERALASFMIATSAASMGMEVTMFFTFWGLNILKRNEGAIQSQGIMKKMLNWMNRGGTKRLKLSKFNMFGLGTWMMKRLMKDANMPSLDELIAIAKDLGVKIVACTTTMGVMGISKAAFRPEVDVIAGATAYLGEAKESKVNLFV